MAEGRPGDSSTNLESAIPANALYQAKKAASMPKTPPAFCRPRAAVSAPLFLAYSEQKRNKKARSRVKKRLKNMMVERRVQSRRMVVKMNQPVRNKPMALVSVVVPS